MSDCIPGLILAFRPGALGDTLLTIDTLQALRSTYPEAPIELVGHGEAAALLAEAGVINRATAFDALEVTDLYRAPPRVADRWHGARLVVLWMRDAGPVAAAFTAAEVTNVLTADPAAGPDLHQADHLTTTLGVATPPSASPLVLRLSQAARGAHGIFIHPGSGSPAKNWPAENFAELIVALDAPTEPVVVIEGPADGVAVADVLGRVAPVSPPVLRARSIRDLAGALMGARVYIGNDSGVTHLAARLGVPTVAIFGASDPRRWAPRGPVVRVLGKMERGPQAEGVSAANVPGQEAGLPRKINRWPSVEEVRRTTTDLLGGIPGATLSGPASPGQ